MNLAKVWPLRTGLKGHTPDGHEIMLQPGVAGFMEYAAALTAQARGQVQLMAGQTPQSLRTPDYNTRDLAPESTPSELLRVPKDGSAVPPPPRRKKRTYSRRDIRAEKPMET